MHTVLRCRRMSGSGGVDWFMHMRAGQPEEPSSPGVDYQIMPSAGSALGVIVLSRFQPPVLGEVLVTGHHVRISSRYQALHA